MMFRPLHEMPKQPRKQPVAAKRRINPKGLIVLLAGVLLVVGVVSGINHVGASIKNHRSSNEHHVEVVEHHYKVERNRLCRNQIPKINIQSMNYREMFDDLNDIQLEIATKNGLKHPEQIEDPATCPDLVKLNSCDLFRVDTMYYSKPFVIPEAVLLLRYIGQRFQEVMKENYPENKHHYRLVVTSALRSEEDVNRLRRRNRNATEKSCHRFGTTLDISYIRFERDGEEDVNEVFLKNMLALALYELRYEGLCYVKYERGQSCFHFTVRNTEYKGKKKSETLSFPDSAGVTLGDWGDDGTLTATEVLTREFRQNGTIHGEPVNRTSKAQSSSLTGKNASKSSTKKTKKTVKPTKKSTTASRASTTSKTSSDGYRKVPAPGKSGEEEIMAW